MSDHWTEHEFHPYQFEMKSVTIEFKLRGAKTGVVLSMHDQALWDPEYEEMGRDFIWRMFKETRDRFEKNLQPGEW